MNIILIGFMGSGKSTVADALAKELNYRKIETDSIVLEKSGFPDMKTFFNEKSEIALREFEIEISRDIAKENEVVIDTGGGMVLNKITIDYFKSNDAFIVFLDTSFHTIEKRLKGDKTRPLFENVDQARSLYSNRFHLYRNYADYSLKTDNKSIEDIVALIIKISRLQ